MEKIVNIKERIESKKQKKQLAKYRGKIEAIKELIQCASCHFRCAMCGQLTDVKDPASGAPSSPLGLKFCEDCQGEFEEFLSISSRGKRPKVFWHNKEWVHMWSAWLNYRRAMNGFLNSPEFKLLLEEFDTDS